VKHTDVVIDLPLEFIAIDESVWSAARQKKYAMPTLP
jgi:hypothetical protein